MPAATPAGGISLQNPEEPVFFGAKRHLVYAAVVQLVERYPSKVDVASSSLVCRSIRKDTTSNADDSISSTVTMKGMPGTDI